MRIAIVHDWLDIYAGAERVLEQMLICFPDADLFSLVDFLDTDSRQFIQHKTVKTTFIQQLPFARRYFRFYLPLFPLAIWRLKLDDYDLILSSSHCVAKGVTKTSNQLHICICHSPMRYAWDLQEQYLEDRGLSRGVRSKFIRAVLQRLRKWDVKSASSVDKFIAISGFVGQRINRFYGRSSEIIHPPVSTEEFTIQETKENFYLTASRLVPYKKISLIADSFLAMPDKQLVIIGEGPDHDRIRKITDRASNISMLTYQSPAHLKGYMQRAKAFIFAALEDFGIVPLEAQSCGTPVIAFGKGGAAETIRGLTSSAPTGLFFGEQTRESICQAVDEFESSIDTFTAAACHRNAERFSQERFRGEYQTLVNHEIEQFFKN